MTKMPPALVEPVLTANAAVVLKKRYQRKSCADGRVE